MLFLRLLLKKAAEAAISMALDALKEYIRELVSRRAFSNAPPDHDGVFWTWAVENDEEWIDDETLTNSNALTLLGDAYDAMEARNYDVARGCADRARRLLQAQG